MNTLPLRILPPVLDDRPLRTMAEDTTRAVAEQFAADYSRLLPRRILRVRDAVRSGDREAAADAVLSLKTSSALIGASRMALICIRLHHALDRADTHEAEKAFQEAKRHLPHLRAALATSARTQILLPV
jgi:HPt (histidine-containing phosphotransfer) domain-containing protein